MSALTVLTAFVVVTAAALLLLRRTRPRRGAYRFIVALRPQGTRPTTGGATWRTR